jgi:membrane-bound lytic murein transglycosylase MltF
MRVLFLLLLLLSVGCSSPEGDDEITAYLDGEGNDAPEVSAADPNRENALFERLSEPFHGDLAQMKEKGVIRVLISYSKTNFFFAKAAAHGFEYELLREWEKELIKGVRRETDRVKLVFIPTPFDRLLDDLAAGRGDLAAAGLTITPERQELADFTTAYIPKVSEVVVAHNSVEGISGLEDLGKREFYIRPGSSYITHLEELNKQLKEQGQKKVKIRPADRNLATEDILELVNAGVVPLTVADRHLAELWAGVLPDLVIRDDLVIHEGGGIGWAVRKKCPQLLASLDAFARKNRKGSLLGNILFKRYYRESKWIRNPMSAEERKKLDQLVTLFQKYSDQYTFDWLALAAQAYQESELNNNRRSRAGAVGIMQIKPSTAADKAVGISNVHELENNIHAGTKYLHYLRDRYFSDPEIDEADRVFFSWAAYNAGPGNIAKARRIAAERGLDPNRWFFNVEKVVAQQVGSEPVRYVANVNKYYVAYRLAFEAGKTAANKK